MPAERNVTRGFAHADATAGEEPPGARDPAGLSGPPGPERLYRPAASGVQKRSSSRVSRRPVIYKGLQPLFFILRYTGCLHVISGMYKVYMQMKRCLDLTECNYSSRLICQRLNFRYRNSRLSLVLDSPEDRGMTGSVGVRGICKPQDFCRDSTYNCYLD